MSTHTSRSELPPISAGDLSDEPPSSDYPRELVEIVEVANGQRVTVRPVLPVDAAKFHSFVTGLSDTSRTHRFMSGLRKLSPPLLQRLTRIDYRSHMALVAETQRDGMPIIIAEARYAVDPCRDSAELAVAVADEWQGLGLAKALLRRLIGHAAKVGWRRLHGETLASNACIMHLAWAAGFSIMPMPGVAGVLQLERNIALQSPLAPGQALPRPFAERLPPAVARTPSNFSSYRFRDLSLVLHEPGGRPCPEAEAMQLRVCFEQKIIPSLSLEGSVVSKNAVCA